MFETAATNSFHIGGEEPESCNCLACRAARPFDMPDQLSRACIDGDLVVFAGSGVSTESPMVMPITFYDHICAELGIDPAGGMPFPEVMSHFEKARGRIALLEEIKRRLDYVRSFATIDHAAGSFHTALSGVFTVREIVTTNWDEYFERFCGAQPFVTDEDWAYWKVSSRKVFKLHGSILNPGSIVATEADYARCYRDLNKGLVGAKLKEMLATKTVVFVGYSLRDADFIRLYRLMKGRMGDLLPRSYVVTLDDSPPTGIARDMHVIQTSGIHFVQKLKEAFSETERVPDDRFRAVPVMREIVRLAHHDMIEQGEMREDPAMLMCACYQDGVMDALDHIDVNMTRGDYHHRCYTESVAGETYPQILREREERGAWLSVAYVEGYMNGLSFLLADDTGRSLFPLFYVAGSDNDIRTYEDYRETARYFPTLHKAAYEYAKHEAERLAPGVVFQHLPTLL